MRSHLRSFALVMGAVFALADPSQAGEFVSSATTEVLSQADTPYWAAYAATDLLGGSDRVLSSNRLAVPLYQDPQNLLFADLRGVFDDHHNREANWGLAWRSIVNDEMILGAYAFYDHRWSQTGNQFDQATLGMEFKTRRWDAHLNGYLADGGASWAGLADPRAEFINHTIMVVTDGTDERAYSGLDWELGSLLTGWGEDDLLELRGYVGGYYLSGPSEFPDACGPRLRLELRGYEMPWLGTQSRLTLGVEYAWDEIRDDQVVATIGVQIPLNLFQSRKLNRLQRRMLDPVRRDVDIVTNARQYERIENASYVDTGEAVGTVYVMKAGDILADTVAGAGANSTVIVDGSAGNVGTDTPAFMFEGQTIRGAGFEVRGVDTGAVCVFGVRPTIVNTNPDCDTIVVADNATVRDLDIEGGRAGISTDPTGGSLDSDDCDPVEGVRIMGNSVTGAYEGYLFNDVGSGSEITDNIAQRNDHNGFYFQNASGAEILGNLAVGNGNDGFNFSYLDSGTILSDNWSLYNDDEGFDITAAEDVAIEDNVAIGNEDKGFQIAESLAYSEMHRNISENNGEFGFDLYEIVESNVTDNEANDNDLHGFAIYSLEGSTFANNSATGNGEMGFYIVELLGSSLENNVAARNDVFGFYVDSPVESTISGNEATDNSYIGFYFADIDNTTIDGNIASGNGAAGFHMQNSFANSTLSNNQSYDNDESGFYFACSPGVDSFITSNTASGNGEYGFFLPGSDATATFANNVASNNFDTGFRTETLYGTWTNNQSRANGYTTGGQLQNADANGFYFAINDGGTFTGNTAEGNAGNGFAGDYTNGTDAEDAFVLLSGKFSDNLSNNNGDKGYRGYYVGGDATNNTGTGNANGGDSFP